MMSSRLPLTLFLLCLVFSANSQDATAPTTGYGRITHVEGTAETAQRAGSPFTLVTARSMVRPGQVLRTAADGRLEIRFLDGTIMRLGAGSEYTAQSASFSGNTRREFTARLTKGRAWARVASARRGRFNINTPSAVVSVRGTTYDLLAGDDESTEVSVYEGRVGVAPPPVAEGAAHEEIAWPMEVSEDEWEEIILGKLQRLRVGPDGQPGAPEAFLPDEEQDAWVQWNQARDAALSRE